MFKQHKSFKIALLVVLLITSIIVSISQLRPSTTEGNDLKISVKNGWKLNLKTREDTVDGIARSASPFLIFREETPNKFNYPYALEGFVFGAFTNSFGEIKNIPGRSKYIHAFVGFTMEEGEYIWRIQSKEPVYLRLRHGLPAGENNPDVYMYAKIIPTFWESVRTVLINIVLFTVPAFLVIGIFSQFKFNWNEKKHIPTFKKLALMLGILSITLAIFTTAIQLKAEKSTEPDVFTVKPFWKLNISIPGGSGSGIPITEISARGSSQFEFQILREEPAEGCTEYLQNITIEENPVYNYSIEGRRIENRLEDEVFYNTENLICEGEYEWILLSKRKVYMSVPYENIVIKPSIRAVLLTFFKTFGYISLGYILILASHMVANKLKINLKE